MGAIMDYGATVVALTVPDQSGELDDVVLGFDEFRFYTLSSAYFGAMIGRYANRVANGRFVLNRRRFCLLFLPTGMMNVTTATQSRRNSMS
jgi:aldose 1-epimerase